MTEIRPISESEGDEFLRLLCTAFDLDFGRARNIFFREPLFDYQRKWALFLDGKISSILTTVPLLFGWGRAIGIAGVATKLDKRRQGLAAELLTEVVRQAAEEGEGSALLFAKSENLYGRLGFRTLDHVVRAKLRAGKEDPFADVLSFDQVTDVYESWSCAHPDRLRRDELRWKYWKWNLRVCSRFGSGYVCNEGGLIRECITDRLDGAWPVDSRTEWLGLQSMAANLNAPIENPTFEHYFMGYNVPSTPQMFMTDQF